MKAELARELGLFEETKRLLAFPFSGDYHHAVHAISLLVGERHRRVALVQGAEELASEGRDVTVVQGASPSPVEDWERELVRFGRQLKHNSGQTAWQPGQGGGLTWRRFLEN
jgi:hypothetical protein